MSIFEMISKKIWKKLFKIDEMRISFNENFCSSRSTK